MEERHKVDSQRWKKLVVFLSIYSFIHKYVKICIHSLKKKVNKLKAVLSSGCRVHGGGKKVLYVIHASDLNEAM